MRVRASADAAVSGELALCQPSAGCLQRAMVVRWMNRTQPQRKAAGRSSLSQNLRQTEESWHYFTYFIFESFNPYCDVVLRFVIALRAALAGCSEEAKCHINWAFSLILCSYDLTACSHIKTYISHSPPALPLGFMVRALTKHTFFFQLIQQETRWLPFCCQSSNIPYRLFISDLKPRQTVNDANTS